MKIFSENVESIIKELELIKDSFGTTSIRKISDNIEMLESFYELLLETSGLRDTDALDILTKYDKYRDIKTSGRNLLRKKTIENFIQNKDFHKSTSGKVIKLYDKKFNYYGKKNLNLKEDEMCEILCNFLADEFNQADEFKQMINEKRIFRLYVDEKEFSELQAYGGYTMFDYITRNNFIVVSNDKSVKDMEMMRIIAHEFGHAIDNKESKFASRKDIVRYYWISSYGEVFSMLYEKLFVDYLLKNNIYKDSANWILFRAFYKPVYDNFNSLEYISSLEDKLITNKKYQKEENIPEQIEVSEDGVLYIAKAVIEDFDEVNRYSYGGLLANYFAYLKHNDEKEFKRQFDIFKNNRFKYFNPKLFEDLGTNIDEIISIYNKGLEEMTDNKKLILK